MTALPARCGVLGAGRMGSGIAHALLLAGCEVDVVENSAAAAGAAADRIGAAIEESTRRDGGELDPGEIRARLRVGVDAQAFTGCGLVIEAVPELPDLKASSLRAIESAVGDDAVIATNTSSLSVAGLAGPLKHGDRFLGLHFFNPVPVSALVEVVRHAATDEATVTMARGWVEALGKTAIVIWDSPGFASSRLGLALGLEAIRMVADGVASPADIDLAMTLGYRHPVGPLRLTDIVGLDVRLDIADYLAGTLGDRFQAPQLMRDMVARGDLGRKSGRGFYSW